MNEPASTATDPAATAAAPALEGVDVMLFERPMEQRVTSQMASQWLATVDPRFYRPVNDATVQKFAAAMRQDQWRAEPVDPIRFDVSGRLRGGRMRLLAVVASGATVPMFTWTPPPCQPHEIIPRIYEHQRGGIVTAMRWNGDGGDGFDELKQWVAGDPRQIASVERDPTGCLLFRAAPYDTVPLFWLLPGDWLVHGDDGYHNADHLFFAPEHIYRGMA